MKIGFIGSGNFGAILLKKLSVKHQIKVANSRGPESLKDLAAATGAKAVTTEEAIQDVDVIIISIPYGKNPVMADLLAKVPKSVPIIDTANYYPQRDGHIDSVDKGQIETHWTSELLHKRPITKAWNAILAKTLDDKDSVKGAADRLALPVAGDDQHFKDITLQLVEDTGFDAVDTGSIAESWRFQPGTPGYCTELKKDELLAALDQAKKGAAPAVRDATFQLFFSLTHEELVAHLRSATAAAHK